MTRLWVAVLVAGLFGCGSHLGSMGSDAGDAPADQAAGDVDVGGCIAQTRFACIIFSCCNDEGTQSVCVDGTWMCPEGSVDIRTCPPGRVGGPPPPGCNCTEAGVTCSIDGSAPDAPSD